MHDRLLRWNEVGPHQVKVNSEGDIATTDPKQFSLINQEHRLAKCKSCEKWLCVLEPCSAFSPPKECSKDITSLKLSTGDTAHIKWFIGDSNSTTYKVSGYTKGLEHYDADGKQSIYYFQEDLPYFKDKQHVVTYDADFTNATTHEGATIEDVDEWVAQKQAWGPASEPYVKAKADIPTPKIETADG